MKKKDFFSKKVLTIREGYGIIIKSKKKCREEKAIKS